VWNGIFELHTIQSQSEDYFSVRIKIPSRVAYGFRVPMSAAKSFAAGRLLNGTTMTRYAQSTIGKLDPPAQKESPLATTPREFQVQGGGEECGKHLFTNPVPNPVSKFQETYLPQGRDTK
jgi:hypothetical protein